MDKNDILRQVRREYENGVDFRRGRLSDWQAVEDLYFNRVKKSLKGRFNVPMPVMPGFVDTLHSKIDEPPSLRFKETQEADFRATKKVQAFWDGQSKAEDNDLDSKDLDGKKLAIMTGRAIFKLFGESDPRFRFNVFVTDPYDFYIDPMGGGNMENALYMGEDNIWKSKSQLKEGAIAGRYDRANVGLIINGLAPNAIKDQEGQNNDKANRFAALGLSNAAFSLSGEGAMRFIESGTVVNGTRYYVLWNYETGLELVCKPIKEKFESGLWWWTSWATHRDPFNFWNKAPADDIRPIAEMINVLANQELDNRQKRNFGQRAYDPDMFPNGAELEYRPNGLVAVTAGASKVQPISSGIYQFETAELSGTIDLVTYLDNFAGQKSGVTSASQGNAEEQKVGIYNGNLQQVADRLGLYNRSYVKCHAAIGRRFIWACKEHITKGEAVRLIGEKGVEWTELSAKEVNPDVDILVESGASEMQINEAKKQRRANGLAQLAADPALAAEVNRKWRIEQILLSNEYSDEEVRVALDTNNDGDRDVLARASEAIVQISEGKQPKLFRGATTGFMQKIVDFALDNTDGDLPLFEKLMAYSKAHEQIVMENMARKARQVQATRPPPAEGMGMAPEGAPMAPEAPMAEEAPVIPQAL